MYLYEDHEDNPWKAVPLKLVTAFRRVTTRLSPKALSLVCCLLSPFVVLAFSLPARLLGRFAATRSLADRMPFNFGASWFSVHGDLLDRFGAPIEVRYNRESLAALLRESSLGDVAITKLRSSVGWVAKGVKVTA